MGNKLLFGVVYLLCAVILLSPSIGFAAAGGPAPQLPGVSGGDQQTRPPASESEGDGSGAESGGETDRESDSSPETDQPSILEPKSTVSVYLAATGEAVEMLWEEYITRVVMAEVPHSFGEEVLKAQAVAARTYCLYRMTYGDPHGDTQAGICTDYTHCMAYISEEEAADRWGEENASEIYETIRAAVKATEGEYLSYEGLPIAALFHSCSVGKTENASQVWGREYPYLISVSSEEEARITQVKVPLARLNEILQSQGDPDFSSALWNDSNQISLSFTSTGRVSTLALNGYCMKATLLRIALGLRSTDFTVEIQGDEAVFTVRGSGHGVGMSQYGAEAMAKSGADYREILLHYYSGVRIENVGKA